VKGLRSLGIVAAVSLLLLVAVPTVSVPVGFAQVATDLGGSVAGTITSDLDAPLGGAIVSVEDASGSTAGSAVSNPDGSYLIESVAAGSYTLRASARGHAEAEKDIIVGGSLATDEDLVLQHTGSVVRGSVTDGRTSEAVPGATIEAQWSYNCKPDAPCPLAESRDVAMMQPMPTSTVSGRDGGYAISVEPGHYSLRAWKEGFQDAYAELEAAEDGDATINLQLNSIPPRTAALQGQVTDGKTGQPVRDAWVNAWPYYEPEPAADCPPGADCPASSTMPVRCCYYNEGNSTSVDEGGHYKMGMYAGRFMVSAYAPNYGQFQQVVTLEEGATTTLDIALEPIPEDSVVVRGTVVDKVTGKPVANAYVSAENQQWGSYNGAQTDELGRFTLKTKPGWTLVWVRADYGCCIVYAQGTAVAEPSATSGSGGGSAGSEGNVTAAEPSPPPGDEGIRAPEPYPAPPKEGQQSYYPWVRGAVFAADQQVEYRVELQPKPNADIRIVGYVLNATSHKAIPGAWVNIHNEDTGDWGYAQTDEDGSFVIMGRAGVHTIQAGADGYFGNSVVVTVKGPETRVDLSLQPGRSSGYCCVMYAGAERAMASDAAMPPGAPTAGPNAASAEGTSGAATGPTAQQALTQAPPGAEGPATYAASGQGLGPYDPNAAPPAPAGPGDAGSSKVPFPGAMLVLAGIAAAALVVRARRR
jgi:hypothetical protein